MYLNLYSFLAHAHHEKRVCNSYTFENEEWAKKILDVIREYNKGKDVIYTCIKCKFPDSMSPRYLDMMWEFGYTTHEEARVIREVVDEMIGDVSHTAPIGWKNASCPFMEA